MIEKVHAERDKVFQAFIRPDMVLKWFCPEGMSADILEWNAVEGGNYSISLFDGEDDYTSSGTFLVIEPFSKIVFSYIWEEEELVETKVTVEFNNADLFTEIILTHEGIDPEDCEGHKEGWASALSKLASLFK